MTTAVYLAAMHAYSRAIGERRWQDALGYLEAAGKAAGASVPAWVADARAELEALVASGRSRPLKYGDAGRAIDAVCAAVGVLRSDVMSERRDPKFVTARRLVCWILRTHSTMSLQEISEAAGLRSHSAVIDAVGAIQDKLAGSSAWHLRPTIAAIEAALGLTPHR
ncbi:MAG: hypothetical protein L6Q35_00510 [Phycisphaerales bacterium]|nr:hypothetical protein [Phycisphaerales bacterium]